ncbi:MAG: L(+)-tartrate dehydratase subunit beta [Sphaerochaeta sp.]|nr:L(+)-tartrate dehydratase subunit beta [Sphaerochaeta sp.]
MKKILTTPVSDNDLKELRIGDVIYLSGHIVTCRDVAHRRLIEYGRELPIDISGGAIFHAGPIVRKIDEEKYEMVSIGPTTSMRMEKFEKEFIKQTGVKVIVGKGGMGQDTVESCSEFTAIHCVFPAGCAVIAATQVEEIERSEWMDLGMPETLWLCRIREFGPLIVSIDTHGGNLFEKNKILFNEKKDQQLVEISKKLKFIK